MIDIWIPGKPPTATAQQKGRTHSGVWYKPKALREAEETYMAWLKIQRPAQPMEGAVVMRVDFCFPANKPHKPGEPKITRPDTDNMIKLLKDCLTRSGYWKDDAQVADETVIKIYDKDPGIRIMIRGWNE